MLLTHLQEKPLEDYLSFIKTCALNGLTSVQLRHKGATFKETYDFGRKLKDILDPLNIPLIVNDNAQLAKDLEAFGVHLGNQDDSYEKARNLLKKDKAIGLSIESFKDLEKANLVDVSYVAASAVFQTPTKSNVKTLWGDHGVRDLAQLSNHPVIAIGGIALDNAKSVLEAGAKGLCVIGALHNASNPAVACKEFKKLLDQYLVA
ncbi:MAG TPA: thiamine phosphate synthase [Alphaproteobacteria bacterium]|nr:thiamine phosphate synthase [Alphaproteobacteria bacterium]